MSWRENNDVKFNRLVFSLVLEWLGPLAVGYFRNANVSLLAVYYYFIELKSIHDTLTRMLTLAYLIKPQFFWEGAHEPDYPNGQNETNYVIRHSSSCCQLDGRFRGLVRSLLAAAAGRTKSSDTTMKQLNLHLVLGLRSQFLKNQWAAVSAPVFFFSPHNYLMIREIIISLLKDNSKSHHNNRVSLYIVTG